ncbi:siderophore-interacting protein [Asticcacaulis excentricus]|uniref:Siderophore-interacting protein n=1 Tax=Asticcacaulis excentricus (strain ATCC 15261 / DSM 4724 / KCTC 12464 / NCIMB 9791 / VKM B-1370 / CB 48) TaxID=573065 RepID=E8RNH6_ASTEC|nr:siderophore-interacting protein [Asticcacaulis excentricus]ADU11807.1 Siderophore-interacting protein [Asticcacaulis excentricus CB 48]
MAEDNRTPLRVRFDLRRRELRVAERIRLTPHMLRLVLSGDLEGFQSLGFDDHVKLLFPDPQGGDTPVMRDYTPRAFDVSKGLLTLDFALHEPAGPATQWALQAQIGEILHIGGPRGSQVWPDAFAHYLLIGDETALPAIGRRLETAPAGQPITVLAVVENAAERQTWITQAKADIRWLYRAQADDVLIAINALTLPEDALVWVAGEAHWAKMVRSHLHDKGLNPKGIKASGYWLKGEPGAHQALD